MSKKINELAAKIIALLKARQERVLKERPEIQAAFNMKAALFINAYKGLFPVDYCLESWVDSEDETEKEIYELLKQINDLIPSPEPRKIGRIGCATCGSIPWDSELRAIMKGTK